MEYLIKTYTNENETVLDFTMGSGTTGVACKNLNRKFIGIEKDKTYFKIAQDRIAVGATPEAAMVAALTLRDGEMPNTSRCGVCGEPQIDSPSGLVCTNGHGGVDTMPNADLF